MNETEWAFAVGGGIGFFLGLVATRAYYTWRGVIRWVVTGNAEHLG